MTGRPAPSRASLLVAITLGCLTWVAVIAAIVSGLIGGAR